MNKPELDTHQKALSIFFPDLINREKKAIEDQTRFVQYTNATAAMNIITGDQIWLRNVKCMNDFMEAKHSFNCLFDAYGSDEGKALRGTLDSIFPEITTQLEKGFDRWIEALQNETYIACVSEHGNGYEDKYGRLSMWRAYGGEQPIALVFKGYSLQSDNSIFNAHTCPVLYQDNVKLKYEFHCLSERIANNSDFIKNLDSEKTLSYLLDTFITYAFCLKHPGFQEEREWRLVYNPLLRPSKYMLSDIECINGVPQKVYKISLMDFPDENYYNGKLVDTLERIIIGPGEHQEIQRQAFIQLLADKGFEIPENIVSTSGIPLR